MINSRILKFLLKFLVHPCFRLSRGQTLGVRGIVINERNEVLLVRHTYVSGWMFPGGGVEHKETFEDALKKELDEETGVQVLARPELLGLYANFPAFKGDHVAVYIVREWEQSPRKSPEIAEYGFFDRDQLPEATTAGTRRRLAEVFSGVEKTQLW